MSFTDGATGTDTAEGSEGGLDSFFAEALAETAGESGDGNTEPAGETEAASEGTEAPAAASDQQMVKVTVDGQEIEVTLDEALKGYQRQADYTRKTQSVADQLRQIEANQERYAAFDALDRAFSENPQETILGLAQSMGIDLSGLVGTDTRGANPEFDPDDPIQTELRELRQWREEVNAERAARGAAERQAAVDREMEAVKVTFNDPNLDEKALLEYAVSRRIPSLEVAYQSMNWEARTQTTQEPPKKEAKRTAPPIEGGSSRNVGVTRGSSEKVGLEEAWRLALSET